MASYSASCMERLSVNMMMDRVKLLSNVTGCTEYDPIVIVSRCQRKIASVDSSNGMSTFL